MAAALAALAVLSSLPIDAASLPEAPPRAEIRIAPSQSGHFVVAAEVNGASIPLIVDTGASEVVLSHEDAQRAGLSLKPQDFTRVAETANGVTRFAPVILQAISVGPVKRTNIPALVAEKGRLSSSLLGMTFLSQLSRVGTREGLMVLSN